jgi:hypothetical protein
VDWDEGVAATSALQRAKKPFFLFCNQNVRVPFIMIAADRGSSNSDMRRTTALDSTLTKNEDS